MKPPYTLDSNIVNKIVEITKLVTKIEYNAQIDLKLRRENRIKAIHSSLAIENNSLSLEQITAIIEGKRVLGKPQEIQEVKNAYEAYDEILKLNSYNEKDFLIAHQLLTNNLIKTSGSYRKKDVGIYENNGNLIHMGARPQFISSLMSELFEYGKNSNENAIIKSCVFHYEIETIHPFEDGNGRMGRLWQNVILANYHPIFAWIPIETIIHENQQKYYDVLEQADNENDSKCFIIFMLNVIIETFEQILVSNTSSFENSKIIDSLKNKLTKNELDNYIIIKKYCDSHKFINTIVAAKLLNKSPATIRRFFNSLINKDLMIVLGNGKNTHYKLKNS